MADRPRRRGSVLDASSSLRLEGAVLKSTFGWQAQSVHASGPAFGFGSDARFGASSRVHARGDASPGVGTYTPHGPSGAARWLGEEGRGAVLGTTTARAPPPADDSPAPGAYDDLRALGVSRSSAARAHSFAFGAGHDTGAAAARERRRRPASAAPPAPGRLGPPGASRLVGRGVVSHAWSGTPRWEHERRALRPHRPGVGVQPEPGAYSSPAALGAQCCSERSSRPAVGFGRAARVTTLAEAGQLESPGPALYGAPSDAARRLLGGAGRSSRAQPFGCAVRFPDRGERGPALDALRTRTGRRPVSAAPRQVPGPGAYNV